MKKVVQSGSDRERNICWKFLENRLHEDHFEAVRRRMDSEALPYCPVIGCKSKKLRWNRVQAPLGMEKYLWVHFYGKKGRLGNGEEKWLISKKTRD